jgi:hypothetical protein
MPSANSSPITRWAGSIRIVFREVASWNWLFESLTRPHRRIYPTVFKCAPRRPSKRKDCRGEQSVSPLRVHRKCLVPGCYLFTAKSPTNPIWICCCCSAPGRDAKVAAAAQSKSHKLILDRTHTACYTHFGRDKNCWASQSERKFEITFSNDLTNYYSRYGYFGSLWVPNV